MGVINPSKHIKETDGLLIKAEFMLDTSLGNSSWGNNSGCLFPLKNCNILSESRK